MCSGSRVIMYKTVEDNLMHGNNFYMKQTLTTLDLIVQARAKMYAFNFSTFIFFCLIHRLMGSIESLCCTQLTRKHMLDFRLLFVKRTLIAALILHQCVYQVHQEYQQRPLHYFYYSFELSMKREEKMRKMLPSLY